jgi:hypothetical protein
MIKAFAGALGLGIFLVASTAAYAGVDPGDNCKDKKLKEMGKKSLNLLKAFGKNAKKPNLAGLNKDVSKALSKFTKGFTKAEFKGNGSLQGCDTTGDVSAIQTKVDTYVEDVLDELTP